jgi:WD40 repeat protein
VGQWARHRVRACVRAAHHSAALYLLYLLWWWWGVRSGLANTSNNLWYNAQGGLVYYAAAVGVVYDVVKPRGGEGEAEERQKFFLKHDNDITCIAAHPSRQVFATGQQQPPPPPRRQGDPIVKAAPKVYIWDAATRTGPGGRKKAVRLSLPPGDNELGCMAFSRRVHGMTDKDPGDLLLTVSRNSQHTVRVWHWQLDEEKCSGLADGMHGTPPQVYGCAWNPFRKDTGHRSDFVTYGVKHIMFWEYEEINPPIKNEDGDWIRCKLSPKAAQFGTPDSGQPTKHNVLAVCYLPTRHVLAGYEDGSIGVFDHPRADALGKSADDVSEKVLARKACGPEGPTGLIKQLHQKRNLKTVAVQEIRRAHRRGESTDPGSRDGQWGIKNGGCTALTLANTQDVVFSGGGDGRIIEWRIDIRGLSGAEVPLVPKPELGMRDDSGGSDILTPRRVFNASLIDPKGPSRMFVGLDCWDVQADGTRRICAGDTENDVWQIMQRKDGDSDPNYPTFDSCDPVNDFKFKLEGQSDAVFGVAPFPCHELNGAEHPCKDVFATACEDGNVTIWDAKKRKHVRKLEIRRHGCRGGELAGRPVPRGTAKGDLLRVKACAFSNVDGRCARRVPRHFPSVIAQPLGLGCFYLVCSRHTCAHRS